MLDVVITGVGTISAAGAGWPAFAQALGAGELPLSDVDRSRGFHRGGDPQRALLVPTQTGEGWIRPVQARRLSKPSKFAVCAAGMALADAGWGECKGDDPVWDSTAICLGNPWGSTAFSLRLLRQIEDEEQEAISPVLFMDTVANAAAAQVALAHPAKGPNLTLTLREASDLSCLARAASLVTSGRAERVLTGVTAEMSDLVHALLGRFGALTKEAVARPFARDRDGALAAEGATVLLVESSRSAAKRGAVVRARIAGWGRANDPSATTTDWGTGVGTLADAMGRSFARFGLDAGRIGRVVCGAAGRPRGDALEAGVLRALFGADLPALIAPKALVGECGPGYLAAVLWALEEGAPLPPALGPHTPDPDLGIRCADRWPSSEFTLATAFASGGAAAWVVLGQ